MRKKSATRELKVVFDTNALHTQVPSDLVNADTRELIRANSDHSDLSIAWYMPEIVVLERHYQMLQKADQLLRNFQKMDAILGLTIALTAEQLSPKIESVITAHMTEMRISRLNVDPSRVNWGELMRRAALRIVPFQAGETEKGFRDSIILESFLQLVEASPKSAATCRLVLVTRDVHLTQAAKVRLESSTNAEVLPGLEDLRNLINTLISTVDETYVKDLREKAGKIFFTADDKDTLIYREKIISRIQTTFSKELAELPAGADSRDRQTTMVSAPRFIRKDRQRVHWLTQLEFATTAYRYEPAPSQPITVGGGGIPVGVPGNLFASGDMFTSGGVNTGLARGTTYPTFDYSNSLLGGLDTREKAAVKKGHTDFNVEWSTTVDRNGKLTRPQIDKIAFVGTTWE